MLQNGLSLLENKVVPHILAPRFQHFDLSARARVVAYARVEAYVHVRL